MKIKHATHTVGETNQRWRPGQERERERERERKREEEEEEEEEAEQEEEEEEEQEEEERREALFCVACSGKVRTWNVFEPLLHRRSCDKPLPAALKPCPAGIFLGADYDMSCAWKQQLRR